MKTKREFPRVVVNKKAEASLKGGHPWVYGEEVLEQDATENGAVADVFNEKGSYLGSGFYNDRSKILVRILSKNANDAFDEAFFRRRIRYAIDYRKTVMGEDFNACRLVFGEADALPGWTVDRFENVLVTEVLSLGVEVRKGMLFGLLLEELAKDGVRIDVIYERNESPLRLKEGLDQGKGYVDLPGLKTEGDGLVEITENGVRYEVDYVNGQKTGFFLDQKYNRRAAARLAKGKRVLDCFTHMGAFALNCAKAGAASVTAVDVSELALQEVAHNAALNGLAVTPLKADVFDLLTELTARKCRDYDYIILDPPAFTKSNATAKNAFQGYKQINRMAMKLLPRGGYLATCSCSHFMYEDQFKRMLLEAAREADVSLRFIEQRQQGPDHPILPTVPETYYLKFYLLQVL
ncbi:MAG: class I SAM-dependent rRNA methyltransferase [Clostridia bacterium]|nr:class I SAM-dependent rRNA methyltransferase [Clostridia bacterium]